MQWIRHSKYEVLNSSFDIKKDVTIETTRMKSSFIHTKSSLMMLNYNYCMHVRTNYAKEERNRMHINFLEYADFICVRFLRRQPFIRVVSIGSPSPHERTFLIFHFRIFIKTLCFFLFRIWNNASFFYIILVILSIFMFFLLTKSLRSMHGTGICYIFYRICYIFYISFKYWDHLGFQTYVQIDQSPRN